MTPQLTTLEVAALVGIDERRIRKDVEHGIFARPPRFSPSDLVYFRIVDGLGFEIRVADRQRLHELVGEAMRRKRRPRTIALSEVIDVKIGPVATAMDQKLRRFSRWKKTLTTSPDVLGGEPTFPKSRTSVRHIGGLLLRGVPEEEVREDYPHLGPEDLELAPLYATAYPKVGRPREAPPR